MKLHTILLIGFVIVFSAGLVIATITISKQREMINNNYLKIDSLKVVLNNLDIELGKNVFQSNCRTCHRPKGGDDNYLDGVVERVGERYFELFLTKQDSLINSKDKYALELKRVWGNLPDRHSFKLSQIELKALIGYLR